MKFTMRAVLEMFTKGTDKAQKEVGGINNQLDQAADNAARMNKNLNQTKTGKGRAGVDDTRNYRTQRGISGSRGASGRDFAAMARGGDGAQGSFVGAYAAIAANVFALTAAFQALSNAAKVEQLTKGLELMGARGGSALKLTAQNLQAVTDNAISTADAMKAVAMASSAGFGSEEIEKLGKVARGASLALGRDMGDALDRLIKGTIKLEPELLDELGIMTRLDDAVKNYADANRKAVSSLTQTERRQAFMNAVLEEGERKFGDIADQIEANPYDQLSASVRQTSTELGNFVNFFLKPVAKFFADNPFALAIPGVFLLSKALQGLGITGAAASLNVEKAFDAAYRKGEGLKSKSRPTQQIFEGVATRPGEIKSLKELSLAFKEEEAAYKAKNKALKAGEKTSLAFNKAMLMTSFTVRNAALAVRGLGAAIAAATLPMLAITVVVAALTWAFAEALKAFDKFTGNTKEIKKSKAAMKELGNQAEETFTQVKLMLEPGKGQTGNAFDAIVTSAKAAQKEVDAYYRLLETKKEAEADPTLVGIDRSLRAKTGNALLGRGFKSSIVTGEETLNLAKTNLKERLKAENVEENMAKLMSEQYNLAISFLPPAEQHKKLLEATPEEVFETNKNLTETNILYADMIESAKEVNKLARDLFPKEAANPLLDLSSKFAGLSNDLKALNTIPDFVKPVGQVLAGDAFMAQIKGIEDANLVLAQQGVQLKDINELLFRGKALQEAEVNLLREKTEKFPDKEKIAIAERRVELARQGVNEAAIESATAFEIFSIQLNILGVKEKILKQTQENIKLELKQRSLIGANSKAYLEMSKSATDAKLIELGGDANFPEEATYAHALKVAKLEENTANKIAGIKKRSIDLEYDLALYQVNLSIAEETKKLSILQSMASIAAPGGVSEGIRAQILLSEDYIKDLKTQQTLMGDIKEREKEAAEYEAQTAASKSEGIEARIKFENSVLGIQRKILQNTKKQIDFEKKLADITKDNNSELFKGASISEEAAAYIEVAKIPALKIERDIQQNLVDSIAVQLADEKLLKDLSEEQIRARQDKKLLAEREVDLINQQVAGILSVNNSYQTGLQSRRVALDLAQKELQASKDLQVSKKALRDSETALRRSELEKSARQKGESLTGLQEESLTLEENKNRVDSAIEDRLLMNTEHEIALQNLQLEKELALKLYDAEIQRVKFQLGLAKDVALGKPLNEADLNSQINSIVGALENSRSDIEKGFDKQIANLRVVQGNERTAADKNLQALVNSMDGVTADLSTVLGNTATGITAPTAVVETPEAQALRLQQAVYQGFMQAAKGGLLNAIRGGASPLFEAAPENNPEGTGTFTADRTNKIHLQARALGEVNEQAKLLSDLSSTIDDGFNNIFLAAEQGSKAMGEAFADMAKQILRQIALMTIKMLAFKALEMGLNFLTGTGPGGVGTQVVNFIKGPSGAAGGIIGLANGGIMDRPAGGLQGIVKQPTYLVGEGRYNEAVVPLPNGRSIPVQMHGGGSQSNNVAVTVNMSNNGSQTQSEGQDPAKLGQAIAAAVQRELVAQKAPGGLLNRYSAI